MRNHQVQSEVDRDPEDRAGTTLLIGLTSREITAVVDGSQTDSDCLRMTQAVVDTMPTGKCPRADLGFDFLGQPDLHQRLVGNISFMGRDLDLFKKMDRQPERNRLG